MCGGNILSAEDRMSRKTIILNHEKVRRVRLFRDDNPDFAFSSQYVDADILRIMFK